MKDDSLSDVAKVGGYCSKCDTVYAEAHECVGIDRQRRSLADKPSEEFAPGAKRIWNAAIDAAALAAEKYESYGAAYEIRTLKK